MNDNNGISTNNGSEIGSFSCGTNGTNLGASTPVATPEPKSASIPSGSRSEIHYPGVQNPSRIYDSKKNRKIVRIMTVMAYMIAVSLAAIVLSLYYVFLWDPNMQIHNSTNTMGTEVKDINSNLNQVQNNILANEQTLVSSSQVLMLLTNRTEPTISTITWRPNTTTTLITNVKTPIYSTTIVPPKVLSSLYLKRDNISKLVSKTNSANVSSAVETDKTIRSNKNSKIETNKAERVTSIVKFNERNRTDLYDESDILGIIDNNTKNSSNMSNNNKNGFR